MSEALLKVNATDTEVSQAIEQFDSVLMSYQDHITSLVKTKGVSPLEFLVSVQNSFRRTPKLLECTKDTIMGSILAAAELGLMPNTIHQLSFIIPYNNKIGDKKWELQAQFQIGYQGWIELFSRHPKIAHSDYQLVYKNDIFKQTMGANPTLVHEPCFDPTARGERIGAYAIAWMKDVPQPIWAFIHTTEIEQIKSKSKGAFNKDGSENNYSPWKAENDPMGWMWKKVAIKQLAKKLPKTKEIEIGIYAEDAVDTGKTIKADHSGKSIALEPLESESDKNKNASDEKNQNVAAGVAGMLAGKTDENPESTLDKDVKTAIEYFKKLGVNEDRVLYKLEVSHIDEIGVDHLTILRDAGNEIKEGKKKINDIFPPIKSN